MDWMSSEYKNKLTLSQSKVYLKLQPDKPCMLLSGIFGRRMQSQNLKKKQEWNFTAFLHYTL